MVAKDCSPLVDACAVVTVSETSVASAEQMSSDVALSFSVMAAASTSYQKKAEQV